MSSPKIDLLVIDTTEDLKHEEEECDEGLTHEAQVEDSPTHNGFEKINIM